MYHSFAAVTPGHLSLAEQAAFAGLPALDALTNLPLMNPVLGLCMCTTRPVKPA